MLIRRSTTLSYTLALLLLVPTVSEATTPPLLTLEEAIALAQAQNPALAAETATARAAEAAWEERRAARSPEVTLELNALRTTNPVAVFGNLLSQERFGEENFDTDFLNQPPPLENFQERLRVRQPVWTAGRLGAAIEASDGERRAAESSRERARQVLVYRVIDRYTGAVVAEQNLELARSSLELARANVALVGDLFEGGLVVESDLLQARVRSSEVEERLARATSGARIARAALNLELGRDLATPFALPAELEVGEEVEGSLESLVAEALDQRPDLAAARAGVEAARAAERAERRGRWPELGFEGAWEANSHELAGDAGTNWSLGLGLRWKAFDGGATRARTRRAEAQLDRARELARLAEQGASLEVESAWRELEAARLRLELAEKAVAFGARSLEIVSDRYREGLTTVVELLDAETAMTAARTRDLAARRDLALARAALDLAVGRF